MPKFLETRVQTTPAFHRRQAGAGGKIEKAGGMRSQEKAGGSRGQEEAGSSRQEEA